MGVGDKISNAAEDMGGKAKEGGITPLTPYFPKIAKAYLIGEAAGQKQWAERLVRIFRAAEPEVQRTAASIPRRSATNRSRLSRGNLTGRTARPSPRCRRRSG